MMISSGAETHRVEDTIHRILATTNFDHAEALVFPTGIVVSLFDSDEASLSVTRRVPEVSNNLGRVAEVNQVSREFCGGKITLEEAVERLHAIGRMRRYSPWMHALGYILAASCFCVMFGGEFLDAFGTILLGLVLAFVNLVLGPRIGKGFITTMLAGAAITVTAAALSFLVDGLFDLHFQAHYMIIGGLMPLVPGLAMTNAARDILHGDYLAGSARAIEAFCVAVVIAVGVGAGMAVVNLCGFADSLVLNFNLSVDSVGRFFAAVACSAFAIFGFELLFETQWKHMLFCGLSAALSWAVFLIADSLGASDIWATFYATLAVDLLAYISARVLKAPVIIFLVAGILPLVPGVSIYKSVYAIMYGADGAAASLLSAILCVGVIALAIFLMDTALEMYQRLSLFIKKRSVHQ